jgi:LysR family transcriptional regulator, benzoate and cis,cis-muconate-responsive activator of ben and cat genes
MLPTIDTRLQVAAIVLAEELHYGRAAQRLHIAVSTLSRQIALLEEKLGAVLFLRNSKYVEFTDAGRAYIEETRASLLHAEKAISAAHVVNERLDVLTIGHTPYTDSNLIRMLLSIYLPLYPNNKVQLHSDFTFDLVHSLLAGELDMALVAWPPYSATLTFLEIVKAALCVVLPEYHPASERDEVFLSDLASDQWIIFNKRVHPLLYDAILERARVYGIRPEKIHHIVTAEEAIHLVLEDAGIAFMAKPVALSNQRLGVVVRPLAEEQLQIRTYLALRADESSHVVNDFAREFLRKFFSPEEPDGRMELPPA